MRNLRLAVSMAMLAGAVTSPAFGQTTSSSNALGSSTGSSGANSVGTGTSSSGSSSGSGGSTGSASSGGTSLSTTTLATASTPPINPPASTQSASSNQAISPSNVFQYTYGAVYYQGRAGANTSSNNPGGLGTPLFTLSSGTTNRRGGNSTAINDSGGVMVPLPRNIAYPAQIKFARQPINTDRLQADLRGTISRSSSLSNPAGVQVQVVGNNVTVRGTVRNAEEARLVEGLIRLTPGVGIIQNELAVTEP